MLVNKEIALGLKRIGFDEPCWNVSPSDSDLCFRPGVQKWESGIRNSDLSGFPKREWYDNSHACTRPDKSDVFAWFRKKLIFGVTHPMLCGNFYSYVYRDGETFVSPNPPHDEFETWEEAEDACILKMIELCESKL